MSVPQTDVRAPAITASVYAQMITIAPEVSIATTVWDKTVVWRMRPLLWVHRAVRTTNVLRTDVRAVAITASVYAQMITIAPEASIATTVWGKTVVWRMRPLR